MPETHEKIDHEFYTTARWNNWLGQVKESGFEFKEEENSDKEGAVFVNMTDDVILACLKVIAKYESGALSAEDAMAILDDIREITMTEVEPISEDIDLMIESLQTSLIGSFAACECYIAEGFDKKANIEDLINAAVEAEEAEDIDAAISYVAQAGALVLDGNTLPEMEELPYGLVAEWLDGIDSIEAAMIGADSYKEDDGDYDVV
ncbi:DUF2150 family protein [Methanococcoides sp. FTZ1]|uniref:DUF2150 family protein n=1 Tax=Methanococcoides sp. FTZ1 TaxID=3439061 RepID=UPI003F86C924